jgi:hypothetical protein
MTWAAPRTDVCRYGFLSACLASNCLPLLPGRLLRSAADALLSVVASLKAGDRLCVGVLPLPQPMPAAYPTAAPGKAAKAAAGEHEGKRGGHAGADHAQSLLLEDVVVALASTASSPNAMAISMTSTAAQIGTVRLLGGLNSRGRNGAGDDASSHFSFGSDVAVCGVACVSWDEGRNV